METRRINIGQLTGNTGQIEGLPANPRTWTQTEIDRLAKSLQETPELFEMRPLLVYQQGEEYVILGGNLRYEGAKKNKMQDCPAIVIPADTPVSKLKEIVLKDNSAFGEWSVEELVENWADLPLEEWGVKAEWDTEEVNPEELGESFALPTGDKQPFQQMTFQLADMQAAEIKEALEEVKELEGYKTMVTFGNSNTNGNALAFIVEQWIESRKYN